MPDAGSCFINTATNHLDVVAVTGVFLGQQFNLAKFRLFFCDCFIGPVKLCLQVIDCRQQVFTPVANRLCRH